MFMERFLLQIVIVSSCVSSHLNLSSSLSEWINYKTSALGHQPVAAMGHMPTYSPIRDTKNSLQKLSWIETVGMMFQVEAALGWFVQLISWTNPIYIYINLASNWTLCTTWELIRNVRSNVRYIFQLESSPLAVGYYLYHRFLMEWRQSPFCPVLLSSCRKPKFRDKYLGSHTAVSSLLSKLFAASRPKFPFIWADTPGLTWEQCIYPVPVFSLFWVSALFIQELIIFIHSPYAHQYSWAPTMGQIPYAETNKALSLSFKRLIVQISAVQKK